MAQPNVLCTTYHAHAFPFRGAFPAAKINANEREEQTQEKECCAIGKRRGVTSPPEMRSRRTAPCRMSRERTPKVVQAGSISLSAQPSRSSALQDSGCGRRPTHQQVPPHACSSTQLATPRVINALRRPRMPPRRHLGPIPKGLPTAAQRSADGLHGPSVRPPARR